METIVKIWELFSPSAWKKILLGRNVKKEWYPTAAEDSKIVLRKCGHVYKRQIESGTCSALIFLLVDAFVILIMYLYKNGLFLSDNLFFKEIFSKTENANIFLGILYVVLIMIVNSIYYKSFISGLVGINLHNKNNLKKIFCPILLFNNTVLLLGFLYLSSELNLSILFKIIIFLALLYIIQFVSIVKKLVDNKTPIIHTFCSGNRYYDYEAPEVVRIDKDIFLAIKENINGQTVNHLHHINLLVNNLYICDNNDILIIPKDGDPVIYKPNEISAIKIKDTRIIYDSRDKKWKELTTSS